MSFYRLDFPIKGLFSPGNRGISDRELSHYERQIQYMLHDIQGMEEAVDNGRIFCAFPDGEAKERIVCADLSVYEKDGRLSASMEMETTFPFREREETALCDYLQAQFQKGWGNWFQEKPIYVDGGTLTIRLEEPVSYDLMKEKYEITDIPHPKYPWLHRIRALVHVNEQVERGDLGGYVESAKNLSQEGHCWIYNQAICCEGALVTEDARLYDGAIARDSALISGDARMFEQAKAEGNSIVLSGEIKENARVAGGAEIKRTNNGLSPLIGKDSNVYGSVCGGFIINGNILQGETLFNSTEDMIVLEDGKWDVLIKQRKLKPPEQWKNKENRKQEPKEKPPKAPKKGGDCR